MNIIFFKSIKMNNLHIFKKILFLRYIPLMKVKCEKEIISGTLESGENLSKPIKRRYSKMNATPPNVINSTNNIIQNFDSYATLTSASPSVSIASTSSVPTPSQTTDCYICGDRATGKHYGIIYIVKGIKKKNKRE